MTRYLRYGQVVDLHHRIIARTGGASGIRDKGGLKSAVAQPQMTYGGQDLYPSLAEKAAALIFSLIHNHPFVDGNKRTAHASMEIFLIFNGYEIKSSVDEQEKIVLNIATNQIQREDLTQWITQHLV